jgi:hypothetical protein
MELSKHLVSVLICFACAVVVCPAQTKPQSSQVTRDVNLKVILSRIELSTDKFRESLNESLVRSRVDQTTPENDINTFVPAFLSAIYQVGNQGGNPSATVARVENVLRQASSIDSFIIHHRLDRQVKSDWARVRTDVNELARLYGLASSGSGQIAPSLYLNGSAQLSDDELNQLIQRLENGGDKFRLSLTDAFDSTGYDKTSGEGRMNNDLRGLKKETDQLRSQFDARKPINGTVTSLLIRAAPIDAYMRGNLLTNRVQDDWRTLSADLNILALAYKLSEIGRR